MSFETFLHSDRSRAVIAETVLAAFLFITDPAGILSHKAEILNNTLATVTQYDYKSKASDKIAVVLIGQSALDGWKTDWPLSYGRTADVIHALACAKATGVFFDYTASEKFNLADGQDLLKSLIADSSKTGPDCADGERPNKMAVFFGKADGISTEFGRELDRNGRAFWIEAGSDDNLYPAGRTDFPEQILNSTQVTPAFGAVRGMNLIGPDDGSVCRVDDRRPKCWTKPIVLRWSGLVNPKQSAASKTESCRGELSWIEMISTMVGLTHEKQYEPCPPILTLQAEDMYRDQDFIAANGNPALLLAGRFVFVGTSLAGLNDQVFSPIHGYLPGVYKHAMAMDNLITYGADYPTTPQPWFLAVIVVILYSIIEAAKELAKDRPYANWITLGVVVLCGAAFLAMIEYYRWPISLLFAVFAYYAGSVLFLQAALGSSSGEGKSPPGEPRVEKEV